MPPSRSSNHRSKKEHDRDRMRQSKTAPISVFCLLLSVFLIAWLRQTDVLVLSFIVSISSLAGWMIGRVGLRRIRRHHGVIQGEGAAMVGFYGNMILFALSTALLCWELVRSILNGDIL